MARTVETFVVGGIIKMRESGTGGPFTDAGLASTYQQTHETTELRLENTRTPLGGTFDKLDKVTSMNLAINFREFNTMNLSNLLWADITEVPSAAVTAEVQIVQVGKTTMLDKMPLTITTVVDDATGLEEFDEDIDFKMTGAGIEVLEGSALATAIGSSTDYKVRVTYTCAAYDEIEALTNSGKEWEILFEGANAVGTKKRVNNLYFRCKFGPAESLDWISVEDFMGMQATCEVLADDTRIGGGLSQYMKVRKEKAAA
ncbi:phage tail tube protein [Pseudomonas indica]|uniref:phage tail tube protein n=1 Tax=Pseudomonas indica TaxID=137658 RepID=UPI003FD5C51A